MLKMKFGTVVATAAVAGALLAGPASAHHAANAQFDVTELKVIKGTLVKSTGSTRTPGSTSTSPIRTAPRPAGPSRPAARLQLRRMGMSGAGMMPVGLEYTISYRPSRNGSSTGLMSILEFPDGRKFSQLPVN